MSNLNLLLLSDPDIQRIISHWSTIPTQLRTSPSRYDLYEYLADILTLPVSRTASKTRAVLDSRLVDLPSGAVSTDAAEYLDLIIEARRTELASKSPESFVIQYLAAMKPEHRIEWLTANDLLPDMSGTTA